MKRAEREPGLVRIVQWRKYHPEPNEEGWEVIPAWSKGKSPWNALSPFFLKLEDGAIFENFWQSWKVFPALGHIGPDGNPNEKWEAWHKKVLYDPKPQRHPAGKLKPAYAWWNGQKLGVVDARKQIYIPTLEKLYKASPTFAKLQEKVQSGQNVILIEPDGPDLGVFPKGVDMSIELIEKLKDVTDIRQFPNAKTDREKYVPFGHCYVIASLLLKF